VTVTLPPELVTSADEVAVRRGTSRSAVVAEALQTCVTTQRRALPGRVGEPTASGQPTSLSDDELLTELKRRLAAPSRAHPGSEPPNVVSSRLRFDPDRLAAVCRRHRIAKLSLFGSVLTDAFGPDSDVDVLVEFERGHTPGLGISDVEDDLSALFGGRPVDLVTLPSLHRLLRERVVESAVVQFAA
jgi:hypothetical protein